MNIVSTVVGLSLMGVAGPSVARMAITPYVAQKQSQNFTQAEALAVTIAAQAEATGRVPTLPSGSPCAVSTPQSSGVYQVSCTEGSGRYSAKAVRSFYIPPAQSQNSGGTSQRSFAHDRPKKFSGHQCPTYDTWGTDGYNAQWYDQLNGACKPNAAWNRNAYLASDPDAWLYDINNINGWGNHPGY